MRPNRGRWAVLVLSVVMGAVACHDDEPAAPPGAIVGRFGGVHAELVAGARSVTVQFGCGPLTSNSPLIPNAAGHFDFAFPMRNISSSALYTVEGDVQGDVITFNIISRPSAGAQLTRFVVQRNRAADFRNTACATLGL
jgi:hypothetical protein